MAIVGKNSDGGNDSFMGASHNVVASKFTASENGTITSLHVLLHDGASANLKIAIYDATGAGGLPGAKLAETSAIAISGSSVTEYSGAVSQAIVSGTAYWLAFFQSNTASAVASRYELGTSGQTQFQTATYPNFPDPFGTPSAPSDNVRTVWATYTPSGGGRSRIIGGTLIGGSVLLGKL